MRLNKYLSSSGLCSRRKADILIVNGDISINGNIITELGTNVKDNDIVKYKGKVIKPVTNYKYILLNKPKNYICSCHDDRGRKTVLDILKPILKNNKDNNKIFPVGRLDRNTTGLVLFAKNQEALNILLKKFKNHEIEKHYLALVYGVPKVKSQTLTAYLFKDSKKSLSYISDEPKKGYSKIITSYSIIEKYSNGTCLLDVEIETGKTHQIRAHLAHIGLPIVGDGKYGNYEINKKFGFKTQELKSYILKFNFSTDSGILYYLNGKKIKLCAI